ncbi:hypothetical protein [Erythrobacter sp. SAORIC-644]|uniref:hypothetical protein n=1 Tax=Erythrobacter sp. SAORIC-644 TaxID=1869314 RepID=UPI0011AFCC6C|nr:hypothetical protein [Erythrobacter sp. SAORIC-644]
MRKGFIAGATAVILMLSGTAVQAASTMVQIVPNSWRLENYQGNRVVVWTNGSTGNCARLDLHSSWSEDDRNRFWSTIMTGKAGQKMVFVFFDDVTCEIISFGFPEE